jgi:hypothetical protein
MQHTHTDIHTQIHTHTHTYMSRNVFYLSYNVSWHLMQVAWLWMGWHVQKNSRGFALHVVACNPCPSLSIQACTTAISLYLSSLVLKRLVWKVC